MVDILLLTYLIFNFFQIFAKITSWPHFLQQVPYLWTDRAGCRRQADQIHCQATRDPLMMILMMMMMMMIYIYNGEVYVCMSQKSLFLYSKDLAVSPVSRHFPYTRYLVISPVSRHFLLYSNQKCLETGEMTKF